MRRNIVTEAEPAEYEKIRKFVVGQIAHAGPAPMRLDSNRELAKRFGVSHPTVIKALKDLVSDGFLTIKPGVGTFTNPRHLALPDNLKVLGLISGDGKQAFVTRAFWEVIPNLCNALLTRSESYQTQQCFLTSPSDCAAKELLDLNLAGIICLFPFESTRDALRELKAVHGMPVLSIGRKIQGVSSLSFDFEGEACAATEKLLDEGRRKLLQVVLEERGETAAAGEYMRGARKAFSKRGLAFDNTIFISMESGQAELGKAIDLLKPDGILFHTRISPFMKTIKERVDIVDACRICTGCYGIFDDMGYTGYVSSMDISGDLALLADNLIAQIESPAKAEVLDRTIKIDIFFKGARR